MKVILKSNDIPQFWVVGIVLIYGLVMAEYFNNFSKEIMLMQGQISDSSIFTYVMSFSFIVMLLMAFVIWLITTLLFHMFAILLGGGSSFKEFQKFSGLCYAFPAVGFLIAYFLFERIELPTDNLPDFLATDKSMTAINWIINGSSWLYLVLLVPIIKYLYQINWIKAFGAIVVPIGSVYLLGQFFANFVL